MKTLSRRQVLGSAAGLFATAAFACTPAKGKSSMGQISKRMPVLFVGHGSPMNAIEDNVWSRGFRAIGEALPLPRAILSVSAHWFVGGTFVTGNEHPETIHDFGGFPQPLFDMQYPAAGSLELAGRIVKLVGESRAAVRLDWGLDHGTWSVLHHLRPAADLPVLQLSLDGRMSPKDHLALARTLGPLRDEGVLVMGSGNATHNLRLAFRSMQSGDTTTPEWASRFDAELKRAIEQHDGAAVARMAETDEGKLAHPTLDHFLPMLYAMGAADAADEVSFPIEGFDAGSLSMRSFRFG